MTKVEAAISELEQLAHDLLERGERGMARRVERAVSTLWQDREAPALMTTGEAAHALGIRSVNTIKRWASEGLLEGFRRGGRVLVSRASVEAMQQHSALSKQLSFERELDEALTPFDIGDDEAPEVSVTWSGRRPWEQDAGARAESSSR